MQNQTFQATIDVDLLYFSLADLAARRDYVWAWLTKVAAMSENGELLAESEREDGYYVVEERWPTRAAYLEFAAARLTLEAIANTPIAIAS